MNSKKLIYISAGEVSGDRHAASLVRALKARHPEWRFIGMGGRHMEEAGVVLHTDMTMHSTVGFVEPLKHLPKILSAYIKSKSSIKKNNPDLVIVLDSQGFHMPLLSWLKKKSGLTIPSVYFIAPQEWQWGTEEGGRNVCANTTLILAIFRHEYDFYRRLGNGVAFVGSPVMDIAKPTISEARFRAELGVDDRPILGVFPGSRAQEFERVAPILIQAASLIKRDVQVVLSVASPKLHARVVMLAEQYGWPMYSGNSRDLIYYSHLSLVTSGTVAVEHAVLGTPALVAYKVSPLTAIIGRWLIKKRFGRIPYINMINEMLKEEVVPEFLQEEAIPERIAAKATYLLDNIYEYNKVCDGYSRARHLLGDPGCFERAAEEIEKLLKETSLCTNTNPS